MWLENRCSGRFKQGVSKLGVTAFACHRDARCRQCTGKRLSCKNWSSFNEGGCRICVTVQLPVRQRGASKCDYPPFHCLPDICGGKTISSSNPLAMYKILRSASIGTRLRTPALRPRRPGTSVKADKTSTNA